MKKYLTFVFLAFFGFNNFVFADDHSSDELQMLLMFRFNFVL